MGKDRTARQQALLNYIQWYMLEHIGRPPTLKEMMADKVGQHTPAGAITSKSVLRYNLGKLEQRGDLARIEDGSSRNLLLPGAVYGIPFNVENEIEWTHYEIFFLDIDDFPDGKTTKVAESWLKEVYLDIDKIIYTTSTRHT